MTPDRTRRVREHFDLALDREAGERAVFLAEAGGGDDALRDEVASLLEFEARADGFLERPALSLAARELARERAAPGIGGRIQNYEVLSRLGAGGMGEVYLAEDATLGRKVALKVLPPAFTADAERLARFKREARAASALNHPCIITVHEIGSADGVHFIATEFVDGETLRQRLARGPVTVDELLDVGIRTAEALAVAHDAGIVHRDIKPENIMVRRDGYVKVLDFGLAKLVDSQAGGASTLATEPGRLMGTVAYMSPEQLHALDVDARTDLWSLGVVLFELATGERPFAAPTSAGTVAAILEHELPPIGRANGDLPDALVRIIRTMLEKDRERRYRAAGELLVDLEALRGDLAFAERVRQRSGDVATGVATVLRDAPSGVPSGPVRRSARPRAVWGVLGAAALVAALAVGYVVAPSDAPPAEAGAPIRSIAVLPFLPVALDERDEAFEIGMADTLITRLGGLRQLDVRPISAVRSYTDPDRDGLAVGRSLEVDGVLEGTIQRSGERLRINLRLVRVSDGAVLWAEALDERVADIFDLQDAISERVVTALRLEVSGAEHQRLVKRHTESSEAYDLYVKGRYFLDRRGDEWLQKSVEHFTKAVEADPAYAPAYAGLADAYYEMVYWGKRPPREVMPKAKAAAERALAIDESLAEAHASLAIVLEDYEWRFEEAEGEYRRAIALDARCALARQRLGQLLAEQGRFEEARAEHAAALAIDPLSLNVNMSLAATHFISRDFDAAIDQLRRTLELDPSYGQAKGLLGWIYLQKGDYDGAVRTWLGDSRSKNAEALRRAYASGGMRAYVARDVEMAQAGLARDEPVPVFIAMELAFLGRRDEAFAILERAYTERNGWLGELKYDPSWDPIRSDPRFGDLVHRVGLEPDQSSAISDRSSRPPPVAVDDSDSDRPPRRARGDRPRKARLACTTAEWPRTERIARVDLRCPCNPRLFSSESTVAVSSADLEGSERRAGRPAADVGDDGELENADAGEVRLVLLDLAGRARPVEGPLLAHHLARRPVTLGEPPHDELLRAVRIGLFEDQPDAGDALRVVEDDPDELLARRRGAPARAVARHQRRLDRPAGVLRCDLDLGDPLEVQPVAGGHLCGGSTLRSDDLFSHVSTSVS
jgi:serine/threonine-protein kinase